MIQNLYHLMVESWFFADTCITANECNNRESQESSAKSGDAGEARGPKSEDDFEGIRH